MYLCNLPNTHIQNTCNERVYTITILLLLLHTHTHTYTHTKRCKQGAVNVKLYINIKEYISYICTYRYIHKQRETKKKQNRCDQL